MHVSATWNRSTLERTSQEFGEFSKVGSELFGIGHPCQYNILFSIKHKSSKELSHKSCVVVALDIHEMMHAKRCGNLESISKIVGLVV